MGVCRLEIQVKATDAGKPLDTKHQKQQNYQMREHYMERNTQETVNIIGSSARVGGGIGIKHLIF